MKKIFFVLITALALINTVSAQDQFLVLSERPNEKTFKGIISREVIETDTAFKWVADNKKGYTPNAEALTALKNNADSLQLLTFLGTWCSDSHYIIPKFFSLLDASGFKADHVTWIGVDRKKTTVSHLTDALNVKNVPTIIVYKNGRELGRVVEYGKSGSFDKDLAEIINSGK